MNFDKKGLELRHLDLLPLGISLMILLFLYLFKRITMNKILKYRLEMIPEWK